MTVLNIFTFSVLRLYTYIRNPIKQINSKTQHKARHCEKKSKMLFKSLDKKISTGDNGEETSSSPSYTGVFPCAIQLYANKHIDFQKSKNGHNSKQRDSSYPYACLTYQAVFDSTMSSNNPTLGVWNLDYNPNNGKELTSSLLRKVALKRITKKASGDNSKALPITILLTLDLSTPKTVYSTMKSLLDLLVDFFSTLNLNNNENQNDEATSTSTSTSTSTFTPFASFQGGCCTTSLSSLATATHQFGAAPETRPPKPQSSYPDIFISLVVAGILPSTSTDNPDAPIAPVQSYGDKQAQNLIFYHLHQFAKTANCALLFTTTDDQNGNVVDEVNPETNSNANTNSVDNMNALIKYLHSSSIGQEYKKALLSNDTEGNENIGEATIMSSDYASPSEFHLPNTHDEEVISGAMLRNANYEGYWDASKDSLEKALPNDTTDMKSIGTQSISSNNPKSKKDSMDDIMQDEEAWLGSLAEKLSKVTGLSNPVAKEGPNTNANNGNGKVGSVLDVVASSGKSKSRKSKGEKKNKAALKDTESKDVSSFFENLMNSKK